MIKKGKFLEFIIFFLALILNCLQVMGQPQCQNPISEEYVNSLCEKMMSDFNNDLSPELVKNQIKEAVLSMVNTGDKGTFGREDGCYEAARIQINLFFETEEKVMLDELINIGDHMNRPVVLVKSCQKRAMQNEEEHYASLSVHIFLKEMPVTSLSIKADKPLLSSGETTDVEAELLCGNCALSEKIVTFSIQGPGELNPLEQSTDSSGKAQTTYRADEPGEALVTVKYEGQSASASINTLCSWDLECHFFYKEHHPVYDDVKGNYNDRWQSDVRFENVPLSKLVMLNLYGEDSEGTQNYMDYLEWMKTPKTFKSQGTFYGANFTYYDGMDFFRGSAKGKPVWVLKIGMTADDITPAQDTPDDGEIKKVLYVSIENKSVMIHFSEEVDFSTPYALKFQRYIKIPEEKVLAGKEFSLEFEGPPEGYLIDGGEITFIPRFVR